MITYVKGNIFTSPAKVLVNPVNTVGVMGKGLAKEFKSLFPDMFNQYHKFCDNGQLTVGKLWLYKTENKWVLNFPTKTTWKQSSKMEYIELGLKNFKESFLRHQITSIAFPKLGCGNGELSWEDVMPLMEKYLNPIPISVFIYLEDTTPNYVPEHKDLESISSWLRTEPEYLSYQELESDIKREVVLYGSSELETPISHKKFFVEMTEQSVDIFSQNKEKIYSIAHEDIHKLWSHTKSYGFLSRQNAPMAIAESYEYVIAVLAKLPYCSLTQVSQSYEKLNTVGESLGIQLTPSSNQQKMKTVAQAPSAVS